MLEARTKNKGIHQLLIEFWLSGVDCYGVIVWLPGSVAGDSVLTFYKSDNSRLASWASLCR